MHKPVLLQETIQFLNPSRGGRFVDCTVGGGGHSAALLEANPSLELLAIDRDSDALERSKERLAEFGERVSFAHAPFSSYSSLLPKGWHGHVDGVLADFGVSSDQIDDPDRGFSFMQDGPLDMRMDATKQKRSAAVLLQTASEDEIAKWLHEYGEESHSRRIAHAIVEERRKSSLLRTSQLADLVARVSKRGGRGIHPATRTFQAIRIAVNRELNEIEVLLRDVPQSLAPNGIFAAISFHSLEDRLVKNAFRNEARSAKFEIIGGKGMVPGIKEVRSNPRSRSARVRALKASEVVR